jgi:dTDP-6-deoxy-L-talose 4-dehydrogenase (NAD+)
VVLHLAWKASFSHSDPVHITSVLTHYELLTSLVDQGLKQLAVAGTAHEIGFFEGCVGRRTPTDPVHNYGIAKNFLRQGLAAYCVEKPVTFQWLRFFHIYGHDSENKSVLTKILKAAKEGKTAFALNHGELLYDFIHVETLAQQIVSVISQTTHSGIIHCCSGEPVTLKTRILEFVREHKLAIDLEFGKFPLRSYDSRALWGDAAAVKEICGKYSK